MALGAVIGWGAYILLFDRMQKAGLAGTVNGFVVGGHARLPCYVPGIGHEGRAFWPVSILCRCDHDSGGGGHSDVDGDVMRRQAPGACTCVSSGRPAGGGCDHHRFCPVGLRGLRLHAAVGGRA